MPTWPPFVTWKEFTEALDPRTPDGTEQIIIQSAEDNELTTISYLEAVTYLDPPPVWTGGGWPDGSWPSGGPQYDPPEGFDDPGEVQFPGPDGVPGTGDGGEETPGYPEDGTGDPGGGDPDEDNSIVGDPDDYTPQQSDFRTLGTGDALDASGIAVSSVTWVDGDDSYIVFLVPPEWSGATLEMLIRFDLGSTGVLVFTVQSGTRSGATVGFGTATERRITQSVSGSLGESVLYVVTLPPISIGNEGGYVKLTHKGASSANTYGTGGGFSARPLAFVARSA